MAGIYGLDLYYFNFMHCWSCLSLGIFLCQVAEGANLDKGHMFRDLICYSCQGDHCPALRYRKSLRHLQTGCQACYKQWKPDRIHATRRCFKQEEISELSENVSLNTLDESCGLLLEDNQEYGYCFCYNDFCNSSPVMIHTLLVIPLAILMTKIVTTISG